MFVEIKPLPDYAEAIAAREPRATEDRLFTDTQMHQNSPLVR